MAVDPLADGIVVPLVEERVVVGKGNIAKATVKVSTHVETHQVVVQESLRRKDVVVERVPIGREVDVAPAIRQEGHVTIYPVVEERLHIEKRFFLREELRVSYNITSEEVAQTVDLRSVRADVERTPADVAQPPNPETTGFEND